VLSVHERRANARPEALSGLERKAPREVGSESVLDPRADPGQSARVEVAAVARRLDEKGARVPIQAGLEQSVLAAHALAVVDPQKRSDLVDDRIVAMPSGGLLDRPPLKYGDGRRTWNPASAGLLPRDVGSGFSWI